MRSWSLKNGDPLNLILAADARLSHPDYRNDMIWELKLGREDPPALAIETSFGMRAARMRLFPVIHKGLRSIIDPTDYSLEPVVEQIYPNYACIRCQPIINIDTRVEYWVPSSQSLAGRIFFTNNSPEQIKFIFEWACVMDPLGVGRRMGVVQVGLNWILNGRTRDLNPTCFLSGGPRPGAGIYPGLQLEVNLKPGESHSYQWAFSALGKNEDSLQLCRELCTSDWDSEISRIEMFNDSQIIDIYTGNPDWDAALMLSQVAAFRLIMPATNELPAPSFVQNRLPDQGHALRLDCSDYPYLWRGQTALDSWYLSSILMGNPEIGKGLVDNFIHVQDENGRIDFQPGLAGQRSLILAQPLISVIAWDVFQQTHDLEWLRHIFPGLLNFYRNWFDCKNDRDQDGYPEWTHAIQCGLENLPIFDSNSAAGQGVSIQTVESPGLAAFLISEGRALKSMAEILHQSDDIEAIKNRIQLLQDHLQSTCDGVVGIYHYRDFKTHLTHPGETVCKLTTNGKHIIKKDFSGSRRLIITFQCNEKVSRKIKVMLSGKNDNGKILEEIKANKYALQGGKSCTTSKFVFSKIEKIEINGLEKGESVSVACPELLAEDITGFLPLRSGIPTSTQAKKMISRLQKRFLNIFGIAIISAKSSRKLKPEQVISKPIWNQLVGEGMLMYGYRKEAAKLVGCVMDGIVNNLKTENSFRAGYHALNGNGLEERDLLQGFAPVRLYLQTIGIDSIQQDRVIVSGFNPFDLHVVVQYKGMTITREKDETTIEFSRGGKFTVSGKERTIITLNGIQKEGAE